MGIILRTQKRKYPVNFGKWLAYNFISKALVENVLKMPFFQVKRVNTAKQILAQCLFFGIVFLKTSCGKWYSSCKVKEVLVLDIQGVPV